MLKIFILYFLIILSAGTHAQNVFVIKDEANKQPLAGATVNIKTLHVSAISDSNGLIILRNIPAGKHNMEITIVGFKEKEQTVTFPLASSDTSVVFLETEEATLDEVTVSSTRSGRSVKNTPTRVAVIAEEEINEEASIRTGQIRILLAKSTGRQTQQTSDKS